MPGKLYPDESSGDNVVIVEPQSNDSCMTRSRFAKYVPLPG